MNNFIFIAYTFGFKENYNSEWHTLKGYEQNKILLQGNGDDKSIIIKKKYAHQIKFERTSVNFNMK